MADIFLLFSEVTPQLSQEEHAWFQDQLQIVYIVGGQELTHADGIDTEQIEWAGCRAFLDMDNYDLDLAEPIGFEFQLSDTAENRSCWFYSDEWGSVDRVAHIMRKFLKRFRPRESWSLTYAVICSKPRVGEFDGGAVFVTAQRILWQDVQAWIKRQRKAFERRSGKAQAAVP